jgi:ATP-binding protein involved in chromosome partitioning
MVTEADVLRSLEVVMDPDLRRDIVSLGFVKNVVVEGAAVSFDVELTTPACPVKDRLRQEAHDAVAALPGVDEVRVTMTARVRGSPGPSANENLAGVKNVIAIASGKGGVGKSTVAANLAVALSRAGADVGLLDVDIYGPSIPRMFGSDAELIQDEDGLIAPIDAHGLKIMSMGYLAGPDTPVVWRGPMASRMVQQFVGGVRWGDLDYLVLDLPPGTGDVQLTITQAVRITGAVIVTTPQEMALSVSAKGLNMFGTVQVPVLGIVENMAHLGCPHCGGEIRVFPGSAARDVCERRAVAHLGEIPLDPEAAIAGDEGLPVLLRAPDSPSSHAFRDFAGRVARQLSIVNAADAETGHRPRKAEIGEAGLVIDWDDGSASTYSPRDLRLACPCAVCIDEWTGEEKLRAESVPADIEMTSATPVGRYALRIDFSDGHTTGIFTFRRLRELAGLDA